jgi:hypothetical protein
MWWRESLLPVLRVPGSMGTAMPVRPIWASPLLNESRGEPSTVSCHAAPPKLRSAIHIWIALVSNR